jgi:hypothetical protein
VSILVPSTVTPSTVTPSSLAPTTLSPTQSPTSPPTRAPTETCGSRGDCECPDKCSGHGDCDGKTGACSCAAGWSGKYTGKADNCAEWVLTAWVDGTTTEFSKVPVFVPNSLGLTQCARGKETDCLTTSSHNATVTVRAMLDPHSEVRCTVMCSPADECGTKAGEGGVLLGPGRTVGTVTVYGVMDYQKDGDQKIFLSIGPCKSTDRRFEMNFNSASSSWGGFEDAASREANLSSAHRPSRSPAAFLPARISGRYERGVQLGTRRTPIRTCHLGSRLTTGDRPFRFRARW